MPRLMSLSRWLLLGSCAAACTAVAPVTRAAAAGAPFTVEDMVVLKRLSDPRPSPDGRFLAFVQRDTDLGANKTHTSLWLLDLGSPGAQPRRLTDAAGSDSSPRWASDSRTLFFLSARSGSSQVWRLSLAAATAQRLTDYPLDVGALAVSSRDDVLAISMEVFPDCATLDCTRARLDARASEQASGRVYERLFVRHWDTWSNGTRSHLFTARVAASGFASAPVDVSRGFDADIPGKPFGGDEAFAFSPDGRSLVFSARIAQAREPWSTNFDLFQVPVDGSSAALNLTAANPAWDAQPVFLANGDLAWLAQDRPGFESDRFHIMLKSARSGAVRALTAGWDRPVAGLGGTPDGKALLASADERGQRLLFRVDPHSGAPTALTAGGEVESYGAAGGRLVIARADLGAPADLYELPQRGGAAQRLTDVNHDLLAARQLSPFEQFSFRGWNDETVYGYLVKPYGFESGKRFPVAFVVHGGPQVSLQNLWNYRWNAQAFAGGGYAGGMMNWIEGNWPDPFPCIVNHDGLFDQRMMYYATEELWFPEWEFGGPYYENPDGYERANPADFVTRWHTPMLVIHGEKDFRVPYSQGIASFTALQRRGIESQLLIFPDENHWVLKPANSVLWYHTVLGWLDAHLKN